MCDTLVALPGATARGGALFAKNSDRERNEAQFLEMTAGADHGAGEVLRVTYIEIDQARRTHACLLSRPFWMWGAEMGANEHGVVIGNEAVHATIPAPRRRALIGMDLVRLGLERAATAAEAVEVITTLLERHGQGGDCGHLGRFYYHNSFLIADRREAYVLETVGRWWALERVTSTRSISNALSIGRTADAVSAGLAAHARAKGWVDEDVSFDFAERLMDPGRDAVSRGRERCARSTALLASRSGALTVKDLKAALRDHGEAGATPGWSPADLTGRTICMHAGPGDRRSQTTAAMVSELGPGSAIHWLTASAAPCLGLFKPVLFESGLPNQGIRPTDRYDGASRWWSREPFHRRAILAYPEALALVETERDALEATFAARLADALASDEGPQRLRRLVDACWREADAAEARWAASLAAVQPSRRTPEAYQRSWRRLNAVAGVPPAT